MLFFERLYAAYYFLFIAKRRLNKKLGISNLGEDEDFGALCLLLVSQFLLLVTFIDVSDLIPQVSAMKAKLISITGFVIFTIVEYRYFISNRDRRRWVIEDFRILSKLWKAIWHIISIIVIVGTVIIMSLY